MERPGGRVRARREWTSAIFGERNRFNGVLIAPIKTPRLLQARATHPNYNDSYFHLTYQSDMPLHRSQIPARHEARLPIGSFLDLCLELFCVQRRATGNAATYGGTGKVRAIH